jgi:hypothetical protein
MAEEELLSEHKIELMVCPEKAKRLPSNDGRTLCKILSDEWKGLGLRPEGPFDQKLLVIANQFVQEIDYCESPSKTKQLLRT